MRKGCEFKPHLKILSFGVIVALTVEQLHVEVSMDKVLKPHSRAGRHVLSGRHVQQFPQGDQKRSQKKLREGENMINIDNGTVVFYAHKVMIQIW